MRRFVLLISIGLLLACGCGGDDFEVIRVYGKVTYLGQPIEDGAVIFVPTTTDLETMNSNRSSTPKRTVQIVNGQYDASDRAAIAPGTYRIEIHAYKPRPEGSADGAQEEGAAMPEAMIIKDQVLPDEFNKDSTLEMTIESGSDPIEKDFEL